MIKKSPDTPNLTLPGLPANYFPPLAKEENHFNGVKTCLLYTSDAADE